MTDELRTIVRGLLESERARVRECLEFCQGALREGEPEDDDARATLRLEEARRRWPDVAQLIGFDVEKGGSGGEESGQGARARGRAGLAPGEGAPTEEEAKPKTSH